MKNINGNLNIIMDTGESKIFFKMTEKLVWEMAEVNKIVILLESVMQSDYITEWMNTANEAFGYKTPLELVIEGKSHLLEEMVYSIQTGAFI